MRKTSATVSKGTPNPSSPPPLPAMLQDRLQRCAQRCQDKAQEGLSATPSQKEIDKAQKQLANCLADCAQVGGVRVGSRQRSTARMERWPACAQASTRCTAAGRDMVAAACLGQPALPTPPVGLCNPAGVRAAGPKAENRH